MTCFGPIPPYLTVQRFKTQVVKPAFCNESQFLFVFFLNLILIKNSTDYISIFN